MKNLTYERYNNSNNIIKINLHNGYSIIALSGFDSNNKSYIVSLFLKHDTVDNWHLIEKSEKLEIKANAKVLNSAILKRVAEMLNNGEFNYYIDRYNYEINCFELGNELMEKDRLSNA